MNLTLDEFNNWRGSRGLKPVVATYKKITHTIYISKIASKNLKLIAKNLGHTRGDNGSISALMEAIGQSQAIVYIPDGKEEGYAPFKDTDGLTEYECFELGKEHYNKKERPNFHSSALNGMRIRDKRFLEAYIKGYIHAFKEDEASKYASLPETSF